MAPEVETYADLTVEQLKEELRLRELAVSGTKDELVARLDENDREHPELPVEPEEPVEESYTTAELEARLLSLHPHVEKAMIEEDSDLRRHALTSISQGIHHLEQVLAQEQAWDPNGSPHREVANA